MTKHSLLEKALEVTKEYARSGTSSQGSVESVLERVYQKLNQLNQDVATEG